MFFDRLFKKLRGVRWKRAIVRASIISVGALVIVQIAYPGDRLLPLAQIDGLSLGWQTKTDAVAKLNSAYRGYTIAINMGDNELPPILTTLASADIVVDNSSRINSVTYPWYLRLVPSSLFWAHLKQTSAPLPKYGPKNDEYIEKALMPSCRLSPVDATIKADKDKLSVVPAKLGGECKKDDLLKSLKTIRPVLNKSTVIQVPLTELAPNVVDKAATKKTTALNARLGSGVKIRVGNEVVTIPSSELVTWMDFSSRDGGVAMVLNYDPAHVYFDKAITPKVAVAPGVSKVTTRDFVETSRTNGANGQGLDTPATLQALTSYLDEETTEVSAITKIVPPTVDYTRTYSPTDAGLSALLKNFATDHSGTYGISLVELSGKRRSANYNGDKQFVTASTYKLLVAYSVLKRTESGAMNWATEEECFNMMIIYSDNACAEGFLGRVGLSTESKEMSALGLKNSTFMTAGGPYTTANDLTLYLGLLESGQSLSGASRDRLISAMKKSVYRRGIPAGASGVVANKVGFMDGLFHDAAIVYSPSGTYALAIMTDGSNWATIADLAHNIDLLRAK